MKNEYHLLDLDIWPRKQHYQFFKDFDNPNFNICCDLDAGKLFQYCKNQRISFYNAYTFLAMKTANLVESFRYRIADENVRVYQEVTFSVILMCDDQTFRFCELPYSEDFSVFQVQSNQARQKAKAEPFLSEEFYINEKKKNIIYTSVNPWISFTGRAHATNGNNPHGIPRLVFGKMRKGNCSMPLSIDVHHSLMDGFHVGQFVELIQSLFDNPIEYL